LHPPNKLYGGCNLLFNKCQPKTFLQERIGYAIGCCCSIVRIKRRDWFRHVVCWRCWLFISLHPMDGLLVYILAFNNNVVCFKLLRERGVVATACNKIGLIPPDEEGEAKYSFPVSKKIQLKPNNSQNVGYYAPRRPNLSKPLCPSHPQQMESPCVLHPRPNLWMGVLTNPY